MSINWYPGHMATAKAALTERLQQCHLVLEVRDARVSEAEAQSWSGVKECWHKVPFSSGNPDFERLFQHKKKIIVFNKADLAHPRDFTALRRHFEARGQPVMLMSGDPYRPRINPRSITGPSSPSSPQQSGVNRSQMRALHQLISSTLGPRRFSTVPPVILVVGLPNVGKSTLINQFRLYGKLGVAANAGKKANAADKEVSSKMQKGGEAKVGSMPGVTRAISGFLVAAPNSQVLSSARPAAGSPFHVAAPTEKLFLLDTPGIMLPYIASDRAGVSLGLKLGVVAALREQNVGEDILARFALWSLNRAQEFGYVGLLGLEKPTTDIGSVLLAVWQREYKHKVTRSDLFQKFTNLARHRRQMVDQEMSERRRREAREMEEQEEEDEEDEAAAGERRRAYSSADFQSDDGPVLPHAVAPLRFPIDVPATHPASAIAAAPSKHSAASPSPYASSAPVPASLAELSSEDVLLCANWWLKRFRRGELGKMTLDDIPGQEAAGKGAASPRPPSRPPRSPRTSKPKAPRRDR